MMAAHNNMLLVVLHTTVREVGVRQNLVKRMVKNCNTVFTGHDRSDTQLSPLHPLFQQTAHLSRTHTQLCRMLQAPFTNGLRCTTPPSIMRSHSSALLALHNEMPVPNGWQVEQELGGQSAHSTMLNTRSHKTPALRFTAAQPPSLLTHTAQLLPSRQLPRCIHIRCCNLQPVTNATMHHGCELLAHTPAQT
jgi:hypothetical protein